MRENKFRAWDNENKEMIFESSFGSGVNEDDGFTKLVEKDGFVYEISIFSNGSCCYREINAELMQFTGLLDKNGKEIYDEDILKCVPTEKYPDDGGKFKVHFNNEAAFVLDALLPITWGGFASVEIIGNIYENPELLEA